MAGDSRGSSRLAGRRLAAAGAVLAVSAIVLLSPGAASATTLCIQQKANGAVKGPLTVGGSTCKSGYDAVELPSPNEMEVIKHATYEPSGIDGKPTIQFSGVNVQIVNGEGKTETDNGEGNLVVGYDESPGAQTGSHNLVLGSHQTFTSFGALLGGFGNTASGPFSDVLGMENTASGSHAASVSGGRKNTASGTYGASVSGGEENTAAGQYANAVSGGRSNIAAGEYGDSVSGGEENRVEFSAYEGNGAGSVSGGLENVVEGYEPGHSRGISIAGGGKNTATYTGASVSGGESNGAGEPWASVSGGLDNDAGCIGGMWASVTGGYHNSACVDASVVSGGAENDAAGYEAWIGGGYGNKATGPYTAIFGGKDLTAGAAYEYLP